MVATSNPEYMADYIEDDDMVILGDREEAQKQAIESNASCLIIGGGIEVGEDVRTLAEKHDCIIITTPFDTFSVARLINQSMPIKQFMTQKISSHSELKTMSMKCGRRCQNQTP